MHKKPSGKTQNIYDPIVRPIACAADILASQFAHCNMHDIFSSHLITGANLPILLTSITAAQLDITLGETQREGYHVGAYIQFSHNYPLHVAQVLTAISLTDFSPPLILAFKNPTDPKDSQGIPCNLLVILTELEFLCQG